MSNYADPSAVRTVDLGPCRCPVDPKPHERDSAVVLKRFGYGAKGQIRQAGRIHGVESGHLMMALLGTRHWTLVLPDGSPRPLTPEQLEALDDVTLFGREENDEVVVPGLLTYLADAMTEEPLPNASSGPSPAGTPEKDTPTPTTPTPLTSTSA